MSTTTEAIAGQTTLPEGVWKSDATHSTASFAVKHMVVATFRGSFDNVEATLVANADGEAKLDGTVYPESIVVKDENLAGHLQSPDFFDTERYKEIRFVSTSIRRQDDELVVEGDLTIKGHTHRVEGRGTVSGPAETLGGATKIGFALEAVIDRTEFGLEWNAPLPRGGVALADDVTLIVELELARVED